MKQFRDYCEVGFIVEEITEAFAFEAKALSEGWEPLQARIPGAVGELGKGVLGAATGLVTNPLHGLYRSMRHMYYGPRDAEKHDINNEIMDAKEKLLRALMALPPSERKEQIEKFKTVLNKFRDEERDMVSRLGFFGRKALGWTGHVTNYRKEVK